MVNIETFFTFFNLRDPHFKANFIRAMKAWQSKVAEIAFPSSHVKNPPTLRAAAEEAWLATGIRCQAAEILADTETKFKGPARSSCRKLLEMLSVIFSAQLAPVIGVAHVKGVREEMLPDAAVSLTFVWRPDKEARDGRDAIWWNDKANQMGLPMAVFEIKPPPIAKKAISPQEIRDTLLPSQTSAFDDLRVIFQGKRAGFKVGGISPSFNALVIGPSGAGKTHVVRAAAKAEKLDVFELNLGSWMPIGSKTEAPSAVKIADFVQNVNEGVIFLDEADKLRPRHKNTTDWTRYLLDDVMSLLDARVLRWDGWNRELAAKLASNFIFLLAGAWQEAYTSAFLPHHLLGGTWDSLSIADTFLDENWLPDELIFRVCSKVVEIAQPPTSAIRERLHAIHSELEIYADPSDIAIAASQISESRKGFRGIEEYLVERWFDIQRGTLPKQQQLDQDDFPF